ncbi:adenylate/guanylate cyclase domain-containing protein [Variovorax ginsengisoli]|uniref:Adenylate cyclase n=1 Tax=Variovorax ginsengisoli TaxID=363844 RepID=A0ABT9S2J5_9BURK|nr:adenylate/guanylate cyclase domain-containing protein [Variovorax ginsengisoli]MDP9898566.1 adenylate cyclase [Variovorax ginsengisoli]
MDRRSLFFAYLPTRRNLRWTSGLVLMFYAALHLLNHATGLVSLAAAEALLTVLRGFWHSLPGSLLLYGAALIHGGLALLALWERRTLRMPYIEAIRMALGFSLPLLMAGHLAAMRWAYEVFALEGSYTRVVRGLWSVEGVSFQWALMTAAWAHGCLGLHLALRARAAYRRGFHLWFALAVLLPVLAAAGFLSMGRELQWNDLHSARAPTPAQSVAIDEAGQRFEVFYVLALAALLAGRWARRRWTWRTGAAWVTLQYPARALRVPQGWSVLEASRAHGVPHLSVCGGRARCSTCRVRVVGPATHMNAPGRDELRTLARVHAPDGVRLACQLRPTGDLQVTPLFSPLPEATGGVPFGRFGRERDVAVLFVDLRRWSGLAERQWPADLVYVLDRYFAIVGEAVRESGGLPNQFIGDSVMAIFGLDVDLPTACRQALRAAECIGDRMDAWSAGFEAQFGHRLDFGMGLHAGRTAIGEVGYLETTTFTAVGEVVNTASRLQDHAKTADARLVVSLFVAMQAGVADQLGAVEHVSVRGRSESLAVLRVRAPALSAAPAP